jgi:TRAP-type transport system periplasmic protein
MKNRILFGALGAAAIAMSFVIGGTGAVAATTTIKIGSFTPPKAGYLRTITIPLLRQIEKDSAGDVKFQEFWGGALIRSPRKQWEGMLNGIQDATQVLPSYTAKLFPDFGIFALPFMFQKTGTMEATIAGWKMYKAGLLGGFDKMKVFSVYTNDNSGLHLSRKITSLDQVKGLKFRAPGGTEAKVVKSLGGTPVGMSIRQVAESLNRGVIQGTLTGWSALNTFRITPLIKTHIDLPLGVRSFVLGMRKDLFNKISRKGQAAIDKNIGLKLSKAFGAYYQKDGDSMRANPKGRGVIRPSSSELDGIFKAYFRQFHQNWVKKVKDGQKKYDAMQAILADLRKGA